MDNFDLKKYLAEGKLLKEDVNQEELGEDQIRAFWEKVMDVEPEGAVKILTDLTTRKLDYEKFVSDMVRDIPNVEELEEGINEIDLGTITNIGLGVAGGLVGLYSLVKGAGWVGNIFGEIALEVSKNMRSKAKAAAKSKYTDEIKSIILKFEGDTELQSMYEALPEEGNARNKQLSVIAKYIKSKLTEEEMQYFTDISAMLRTGDIANNPRITRRPDGSIA